MKKSGLPQPKRRPAPLPSGAQNHVQSAGQLVEVVKGELAGARGTLIRTAKAGRWLVKLDGLPAGIVLSIPSAGLRLVPQKRR
jgi:hypothetical protein